MDFSRVVDRAGDPCYGTCISQQTRKADLKLAEGSLCTVSTLPILLYGGEYLVLRGKHCEYQKHTDSKIKRGSMLV